MDSDFKINIAEQSAHGLVVFFDGYCNLCNSSVNYLMSKSHKIKFVSLQDNRVRDWLTAFAPHLLDADSLIVIKKNKAFYLSRAVLEICLKMKGGYPLMYFFIVIPFFLRDPLYKFLAKRRYRWYGKSETCRIPTEAEKARFL